ncbi:MAG: HD-GYP domain-containing protein [Phycisphaerales bacterium]|nr:HD-GYP domain-containing protein [Phycisphaerales bacterium]
MTALPTREGLFSPYATIRERCRGLGLPTWRLDTAGVILDEPTEPGLAGLWLRSSDLNARVTAAAAPWRDQADPQTAVLGQGLWLIPLVEQHRRRRLGLTVALAVGPAGLESEVFADACRSAQIEPFASRAALRRFARFDEASAQAVGATLAWMARDLCGLGELQGVVEGFTGELTQSYETISLMYSLGRSMRDLEHPDRFISLVCDRIHETLPFTWLAAVFVDDPRVCGLLARRQIIRCAPNHATPNLAALVPDLLATTPGESRSVMVTADVGPEGESQILVQAILRGGGLAGLLLCGDKYGEDPQISSYDMQLVEAAAAYIGAFLDNAGLVREQQEMFLGSLTALTAAIDAKDSYTRGHSERVAMVAARIAAAGGQPESEVERIHIAGLVHDVGKIGVPESVLGKPGRLTDSEFAAMKLHPEIGHRILQGIPQLADVLPGVLHHHERWDGKGYPSGLAGDMIPHMARVLALADTFDAMSSNRSYRQALTRDRVLDEIRACSGTQFDPQVVEAFWRVDLGPYDALVAEHARAFAAAKAA